MPAHRILKTQLVPKLHLLLHLDVVVVVVAVFVVVGVGVGTLTKRTLWLGRVSLR